LSLQLEAVFRSAHRQLRPRTPLPEISAEFFPFAGLNHTVRLREQRLLIRISDLFSDAPESILYSLALILLAKLYRKGTDEQHRNNYRAFILQRTIQERARAARVTRGRAPRMLETPGRCHNLELSFARLNSDYFQGKLDRPRLSWSLKRSRHTLGRYDATHHTIFVSRVLDSPSIPSYVVDYVLFHEMLHIKHQSRSEGCRLLVHTLEFREEERRFQQYRQAREWLKQI
jgi:hypothetical protein